MREKKFCMKYDKQFGINLNVNFFSRARKTIWDFGIRESFIDLDMVYKWRNIGFLEEFILFLTDEKDKWYFRWSMAGQGSLWRPTQWSIHLGRYPTQWSTHLGRFPNPMIYPLGWVLFTQPNDLPTWVGCLYPTQRGTHLGGFSTPNPMIYPLWWVAQPNDLSTLVDSLYIPQTTQISNHLFTVQ